MCQNVSNIYIVYYILYYLYNTLYPIIFMMYYTISGIIYLWDVIYLGGISIKRQQFYLFSLSHNLYLNFEIIIIIAFSYIFIIAAFSYYFIYTFT